MKKCFLYTVIFLFFTVFLIADSEALITEPVDSEETESTENTTIEELSAEYRGISLGMNVSAVKELLKKDPIFGYKGDRDISLLPSENRTLIETSGSFFISRSWLQFYQDSLYAMSFKLNTDKLDYYSIYTNLVKKYGEPHSLNPQRAIWENDSVRLILERPLLIKYIDVKVFNDLIQQNTVEKAKTEINRENFINSF
ncbi:hypothetical protein DWQ65_11500 [Treponema phagedenis]|uniref:Uncharacterized protein n=1 Tax=Treponema phagedenis TaxID=162 RepID=A0A0B7GXF1_TREPH|nr:hypothetical protein [Treponema phagedenis]EFW39175.1 hypothetical protein HMPREF9554_00298 [Treponema phagedenis F0421]NVP25114.1 hypothetical protein [Treponema phagedenis]QEJ94115.1 hypothetical protein FUT79_02030 [Treponema phagedenis]QEJ97228.1 hypothetical protein FUT82_03980 [Treponema phagedenis]QEK01874.1 hypothetical protein FUT84_12385 [Treponema phagedenis]